MKIKSFSPSLNGYQCRAKLTTGHSASSYGQPVLVRDDGEALGPGDAILADYRIVAATAKERQALATAGFILPDASTPYDFQQVSGEATGLLRHYSNQRRIGEELVLRGLTPPGGGAWHAAQIATLCLMSNIYRFGFNRPWNADHRPLRPVRREPADDKRETGND